MHRVRTICVHIIGRVSKAHHFRGRLRWNSESYEYRNYLVIIWTGTPVGKITTSIMQFAEPAMLSSPWEYFASSITALPPCSSWRWTWFPDTVPLCPFFTQVFLSFIHHPFLPLLCTTCTLLTLVFKRNEIGHLYLCPFTGVSHIPFLWSGFVDHMR